MAVPKRKKSKMRVRQRKGQIKTALAQVSKCPKCGASKRSHRACPECGYYGDRQVLTVKTEEKA